MKIRVALPGNERFWQAVTTIGLMIAIPAFSIAAVFVTWGALRG